MSIRLKPHHTPRFQPFTRPGDPHVRTLTIPGYRQTRTYSCGFATSMMVMHYFGGTIPGHELFQRLGTGRDGTRQNAIVRELRGLGVRVNLRYDVDFKRLCTAVDRGKLVVSYLTDLEHWVVLYGYGASPERVYVADPRAKEPCEHLWQDYGPRLNSFGMICSAPALRPATVPGAPGVAGLPVLPNPAQPVNSNEPASVVGLQLSFDF